MIYPNLLLQNRYRVLRTLGKGGFSQTFEVDDQGIAKVLKVLNLDRFYSHDAKEKAISLFQREATVLSRLQHPGIPRVESDGYFVWSQGTEVSLHCIVMEKIEGLTLKQWRSRRNKPLLSLTQNQAIAWLKQLVDILEQLHQQELIHRDIKPSNIILRPNGQLALIDFGAVREITETYLQRQKQDETGTVIISSGYTPPEQMEGKAVAQSDFFALGRTFVYLFTGKSPNDFESHPRTGKLQWRESAPQISKELADLVDYLMATFPGQRPQTPAMIRRCIEEIIAPTPSLPPPAPIPIKKRSPIQSKAKGLMSLITQLLPISTSPNPWEKVKLRRTLSGHTDEIRAIAISPDGKTLVSGSYDKTIKLWALRLGKPLHNVTGHSHRVTCVAISPNGQILASGSYDKTIKLWSLSTGKLLNTLVSRADRVRDIVFSPNGQILISSGDCEIKLWAVRTGKLLRILAGNSNSARHIAFNPDSHSCAVGSLNGTLELWNPHNGKPLITFTNQSTSITCLEFSPDGLILASGSSRAITLWNPQTGKLLRTFAPESPGVAALAFSPDSQVLASGSGALIELWDTQNGQRLTKLSGHTQPVRSLGFSPHGDILVSAGSDRKIKLWQSV
ncbi:protein kinase domain-containing protein [Coleofasciculus sp. F4-SAH-05]|uniref:protein kinase domain-containing protein n=1 Tax=Coleofasciculus sp. F4-SAH-05 TaxID=3069525 RepID=UPI00406295E2